MSDPFGLAADQAGLFFNWGENPTYIIGALGHLPFSSSALSFSALNNIILIFVSAMNSVYGFMHPSSFVVVKSRTENVLLSEEEEANVLRAMDAVAKKTAVDNRQVDVLTTIGRRIKKRVTAGGSKTKRKMQGMSASSKVAAVVATGEE